MIASEVKQYASEGCHAYDRHGNPKHQVPYKDKKRTGEMRNTTIRDIRENGWLPSVSSILGVMAKKGLDGWMKEQVANTAWILRDEAQGNTPELWKELVLEQAELRMNKARDLGTEIHGEIAQYLWCQANEHEAVHVPASHSECVDAAVAALKELGVWGQPFSSERTFASPLGYGGTVDFRSGNLIADFKCVDRLDKKLNYTDRCAQLCAYSAGVLREGGYDLWESKRLVNIFISTSNPGEYLIHEWTLEDKEQGWRLFCAAFALWKVVNKYDPVLNEQQLHEVSFSKIV